MHTYNTCYIFMLHTHRVNVIHASLKWCALPLNNNCNSNSNSNSNSNNNNNNNNNSSSNDNNSNSNNNNNNNNNNNKYKYVQISIQSQFQNLPRPHQICPRKKPSESRCESDQCPLNTTSRGWILYPFFRAQELTKATHNIMISITTDFGDFYIAKLFITGSLPLKKTPKNITFEPRIKPSYFPSL